MKRERIYLFDTTLRDGAQTTGVDFSLEDKRQILTLLDGLGIDYVEGGYPGANPLDTELFAKRPRIAARFTAFGMIRRAGRSAANDPGVATLINADADAICYVAKSSDFHVQVALGCSLEENLEAIRETIAATVARGREALLDCEHFFDGHKSNPSYAVACVSAAYQAGARWIILCDTNGGTLPHEIEQIVAAVTSHVPGDRLGIHAHDDTGHGVANALAAVRAGARQIQGTLNGLGERCGNTNLVSVIPTLQLKSDYAERFRTGIGRDQLASLTKVSHTLDELLNRAPNRQAPYVGASAFATKTGIHASAVQKDPRTYEHIVPESVGNRRHVLVSDQSGKSNVLAELERLGIRVGKDDPRVRSVLEEVKEKEALGYAYEGADASFELLARRILGEIPEYFSVERFSVKVERRHNARGDLVSVSEAIVKVCIDSEMLISAAEGNGPVNALDLALRKDLGKYQRYIEDLELLDYRVRIFQGGTDAVTRVLIEFGEANGRRWSTLGVSANIIDASFQALVDAIIFKLYKSGA
jgi:2-isopropylmalate synthase